MDNCKPTFDLPCMNCFYFRCPTHQFWGKINVRERKTEQGEREGERERDSLSPLNDLGMN